jgi:hypothetical protein
MFHGLTFFGIPLEWFLRASEIFTILVVIVIMSIIIKGGK